MHWSKSDRWYLGVFGMTVLSLLMGFTISYAIAHRTSAADHTQQNYLRNYLIDLEAPTDVNWSARRFECINSTNKANRFIQAGASSDDVNKYLYWCSKFESEQER